MATTSDSRVCSIVLHEDKVSHADVLGGIDVLPVGSIALLSSEDATDILVLAAGRATGAREISLHVRLASKFGFGNRTAGRIASVQDEDQITATHVNLFFRDQFLTRSDIWLMTKKLEGKIIYDDSHLDYLGYSVAIVRDIHLQGRHAKSALFQQGKTKTIVRSGSARFTILVQLSQEMLAYTDSSYLNFERAIEGFLTELFRRWEVAKTRHVVSLIVFGRFKATAHDKPQDFFTVLNLGSSSAQWPDLLAPVRALLNEAVKVQDVSLATHGNLLEALHLAAMDFVDGTRALHLANTGMSVIALTAGQGSFDADYLLLRKTTQLLLGNSIGVDIVSLSAKPQHPVPLFRYSLDGRTEYALPHWADISYWPPSHHTAPRGPSILNAPGKEVCLPCLSIVHDAPAEVALNMNRHDQSMFSSLNLMQTQPVLPTAAQLSTSQGSTRTVTASLTAQEGPIMRPPPRPKLIKAQPSTSSIGTTLGTAKSGKTASSLLSGRKISVGPKGLAPLKSGAITTISEAYANLDKEVSPGAKFMPNESKSGLANQIRASLKRRPSQASMISRMTDPDDKTTQPINIQPVTTPIAVPPAGSPYNSGEQLETLAFARLARSTSKTPNAPGGLSMSPHKASIDPGAESRTPWLALLNPCNIRKDNMRVASQYRQWQHVFPKAIDSADFKWTSMCTPASLPLYNDLMPSMEELKMFYKRTTRRIVCAQPGDPGKRPAELLIQLVTLRLAHGFQIVARPRADEQTHVVMSIGADYHELQSLSELELEVIEYNHKQASYAADSDALPFTVQPWHESSAQVIVPRPSESPTIDWAAVDQSADSDLSTDSLFRMRFVLLPMDIHGQDQRDLADDEKRIEGIQRLTQQWQRHRVLTVEDQSHHISIAKKRGGRPQDEIDHNPLAIEYHTRDPSTLVNSQDVVPSGQQDVQLPLFAESERYHTSNFDLAKLVKRMQEPPPHGLDVRDRRWLTRIHLKCFRGDEMTTWLLSAFKDLKTREEAVEIGNDLMQRGVFTHVRHKHDFMDGNYFYQIVQAYRTIDYPNVIASVFNRAAGRSIPPTPSSEVRMSPQVRPMKGGSESTDPGSTILSAVERRQVLLTQTLKYNVDPARRSEQEQIINIHYDRIHNPENCYHIYVDWSLASPMLIRDAVAKWSTSVESYGLRLVQLPWQEASEHILHHPFEQPRYIKLDLDPPEKIPATPLVIGLPNTTKTVEDRQFYYKSVLRKLGFVLDVESATSFSAKVEVVVTCGSMDFGMTQFVHESGIVIAQISNDRSWDFLLLPNILIHEKSHSSARSRPKDTVASIFARFDELARDVKRLKEIYDESQKPKLVPPSPFVRAGLTTGADFDVPPLQLSPLNTSRGT